MSLKSDPVLTEIVFRLSKQLPAKKIYLFGSRSTDSYRSDSDYDLLITVPEASGNIGDLTDQGHKALKGIDASVDLIVMTDTSFHQQVDVISTLPEIVVNEGIEVYA